MSSAFNEIKTNGSEDGKKSDDDDDDDEDQGAYLLNGSVPLQSPLHTLHPWSPGEVKRKNKTHIIVSRR